jgi:signal transduction histidine kinase
MTLRYDINSVALLIQDDGVGLVDGTFERPGLHALRAMHYRVSELGGRLDVFQTEGGGVTVRAAMPLD